MKKMYTKSHVVLRPAYGAPEYVDPYYYGSKNQCQDWIDRQPDAHMYHIERNDR